MHTSVTEIKVRGYHVDLYGHVNNARYLEFLEEARWTHYEGKVDPAEFQANRWAFVVVNANINYRHGAVVGDELEIHTSLKKAGKRSVVIYQEVRLKGKDKVVADADITFVIVDGKTGSAAPIEGRLREVLTDKAKEA